jgi:hypothetical protein
MIAAEWAAKLEASALGEWMRSSALAYPVVNVIHLLGLTLLIGPMLLLDLRLLGHGRQFTLPLASTVLTRFAIVGLCILIPSGALLFAADAGPLIRNPVLLTKLAAIVIGIANALLFRALWARRLYAWDLEPPRLGQAQAVLSILIWLSAGALGRWIAYT